MNKILILMLVFFVSACSHLSFPSLGKKDNSLPTLSKDQAGVVFLRKKGDVSGPVVNIYLDESYFTSLPEGSYKQAMVCSKNQRISVFFSGAPTHDKSKRSHNWKFPVGEWTYLRVEKGEDGEPQFAPVDARFAGQWMKENKLQDYTLSRYKNNSCDFVNPEKQVVIEAQALFKMGEYHYESISPKGREKIEMMAKNIASNAKKINKIEVIGHTDPEGSPKANLLLSKQRAEAMKKGLIKGGISPEIITAEGVGASQLKVSDCATQFPNDRQKRHHCNQPNRRVEIRIHSLNQ